MLDASLAVLGVCAQDDFGVTPRPESVALRLELRPEAAEVVDLAVEDDHERSRRVGHRLRSRAEVDDRESRHPEGDPAVASPGATSRPVRSWSITSGLPPT